MKTKIRLLAALLCLCMVISLLGCDDPTPPSHEDDGSALYLNAVEALTGEISYTIDRTDSFTLAGDTYETETNQTCSFSAYGTDDMRSRVSERFLLGNEVASQQQIYCGGTLYISVDDNSFVTQMTPEEYTNRLLTPGMLTPGNYATVQVQENGDNKVVLFTDSSAAEAWLNADPEKPVESSASVTIGPNGQITLIEFRAEYTLGTAPAVTTVTLRSRDYDGGTIALPASAESVPQVEYIDAPYLIEKARCYMNVSDNLSVNQYKFIVSDAAAFVSNQAVNIHARFGDKLYRVKQSFYAMDYSVNESYEYELDELFVNGKYTAAEDGGEAQPNSSVTAQVMESYVGQLLSAESLDYSHFDSAVCTDLGSLLLIELGGTEEMAKNAKAQVCTDIFADATLLDKLASSYRTETMEYYIAVDAYTGMPTATGIYYKGWHTIEGNEYGLTLQIDQSTYLSSMDAYEAITEESAPDTEPEEKATPLFYHVTGQDGQEMWLLGTIHVGDSKTGYLPQEIYDAFNASDALAVECNTRAFEEQAEADESIQEILSGAYFYSDGSMTKDHFEEAEDFAYAEKLMKATGNYFYNTPYMKLSTWSSNIDNFFLRQGYDLSSDKGVDNRLLMMAEDAGKKILEVESSIFQIQMLNGWSEALQQLMLYQSMENDTVTYAAQTRYLYDLWCSGDEEALSAYLNEEPDPDMTEEEKKLYDEYNKAMSWDRNANMAQVAIDYLESGETVFYAVGLAHVIAEDGLVNALRDAGYTVELVEFT